MYLLILPLLAPRNGPAIKQHKPHTGKTCIWHYYISGNTSCQWFFRVCDPGTIPWESSGGNQSIALVGQIL